MAECEEISRINAEEIRENTGISAPSKRIDKRLIKEVASPLKRYITNSFNVDDQVRPMELGHSLPVPLHLRLAEKAGISFHAPANDELFVKRRGIAHELAAVAQDVVPPYELRKVDFIYVTQTHLPKPDFLPGVSPY
jgi:hypothetical protein